MSKRILSLLLIFTFVLSFLPVYADDITFENSNEPNISINENDTNEIIEETHDILELEEVIEENKETDFENDETNIEELPIQGNTEEQTTKTSEDEDEGESKKSPKADKPTSLDKEIVGVKFNYNKYKTQDSKIENQRVIIEEENPIEKPVDENIDMTETVTMPELDGMEIEENVSVNSVDVIGEISTENVDIQLYNTEYDQDLIEYLNNNNSYVGTEDDSAYSVLNNRATSNDNVEEMTVEAVNNPYFGQVVNGASVSMSTGALSYEKTLLSIPGRNGLDVVLKIRYNSDSAVVPHDTYESLAYESIKSFNNFAVGWSFDMTHVHMPKGRYGYMYSKPVLTMRNGTSYEMDYTYSSTATSPSEVTLKNYKLSDVKVTLEYDPDRFKVEYSDGVIEYIDANTGNLLRTEDRYGNYITYEYTDINYYRASFQGITTGNHQAMLPVGYNYQLSVLSKITDSSGKVIKIEYNTTYKELGTEINSIRVKVGNTVYATLKLKNIDESNNVSVLETVIDGENLETTFEYDKFLSNVYMQSVNNYKFNGSNILITRINYPTGGYTDYNYNTARRSISGYTVGAGINWYEVFKVGSVVDCDGTKTIYEYNKDISGYPDTYPNKSTGVTTEKYSTIIHKNTDDNSLLTTVYTFYQGNLIKEETYDNSTASSYISVSDEASKDVIIDGKIYRVLAGDNALIIYKQDEQGVCELVSIKNLGFTISDDGTATVSNVKTIGDKIVAFVKYTTASNTHTDMMIYDLSSKEWTKSIPPENVTQYYSINGYIYCFVTSYTNEEAIYTFDGFNWDIVLLGTTSRVFHMCNNGTDEIYFRENGILKKYSISTDTISTISQLSIDFDYAKVYCKNNTLYFIAEDGIYEYNLRTCEMVFMASYPEEVWYLSTSAMATNGGIYFLGDVTSEYQTQPLYVYSGGDFYLHIYRVFNDEENYPKVLVGNNVLYIGHEKIELGPTVGNRKTVVNTYNAKDQLISSKRREYHDYDIYPWKTQTWEYVNGYHAVTKYTDELGNVTTYNYDDTISDLNLRYLYPKTVTAYSNTDSPVVTTNNRTADNTRLASISVNYGDYAEAVMYTYDNSYPGNVIEAETSVTKDGTTVQTGRIAYEYGNSANNNNAYPISVTTYNGDTNTDDFTGVTEQNQTVNYEYTPLGQVSMEYIIVNDYENGTSSTLSTSYTYDKNGILIKQVNPDNTFAEYSYTFGEENRVETSYNDEIYIVEYYDGLGRLIHKGESSDGETLINTVTYGYKHGNVSYSYNSNGLYSYYYYDPLGNLERVINTDDEYEILLDQQSWYTFGWNKYEYYVGNSYISTKDYDEFGRLEYTEENGVTSYYYYDNRNNLIRSVVGGNETIYTYNNRNQLVKVTDAIGNSVLYEYDNRGNTIKVTSGVNEEDDIAGTSVQYTYDSLNRLMSETNQLGNTEYYAYDVRNNLIASKDRNGVVTTYTYDNMNRLLNKTATISEEETESVAYTYDTLGNVSTMTDATGETVYEYNAYNMLARITTPDLCEIVYFYNDLKQLEGVLNYSSEYIEYTYDLLGNVSAISKDEETMATYTYNDKNMLSDICYPGQGSTTYGYDWAMRVNSVTNKLADESVINSYAYTYDMAGNQTSKTETVGTQTKITNYTYDDLNRLSSYTAPDGTVTAYTFDTRNNITSESIEHPDGYYFNYEYPGMDYATSVYDVTSHVISYTYNDANQLLRETENLNDGEFEGYNEYTYDLNGNMIDKESDGDYDYYTYNYSYEFDAFNRLKKVNRVEHWDWYNGETWDYDTEVKNYEYVYEYNGNNELSSITSYLDDSYSGTENFYWDRGYIVGKNGVDYYLGVDGVFAYNNGTSINYLLKNAHGDTVKVLCNGAVAGSEDYDPYGKDTDWQSYSSYKYANYYYDSNSGFYYLRNRFYDPSIGRFISEDPVHDGINWYTYCRGNPIAFVDPLGLYYLEKGEDGRIYAIIESGDTLSGIAKGEVADPSAWKKMNYTGDPTKIQVGQRIDITNIYNEEYKIENINYAGRHPDGTRRNLPKTGTPNSKDTLYNDDGTIKRERVYGPDGNPEYDDDYNHGGDGHGIGFPHRHTWTNGERAKQPIPVPTSDISSNNDWALYALAGFITILEVACNCYGMPIDIPGN